MMILAALLAANSVYGQTEPLRRMAVLSDVHLMAPMLLKQEGKAFDDYIADDRKLLQQSPELLDSATACVMAYRPQVVLITGDLSKDGERVSHEMLVERYLRPMEERGIRVFVIPGNHDVDNPHARVFDGADAKRTTTVSAHDFATIYADYGYSEALSRDTASLSYCVQLDPKTRLIAVDACKYEENDYSKDLCVTGGRIKVSTMQWIQQQVDQARANGMEVMMMMHHGIVSHFNWQDKVMKDYLVDNWKKQAQTIAKMGIKVCFTGHFHAQDAASKYGLTDVETGSTVSYPHPFRLIDVDTDKGTLNIHTRRVAQLSSMKGSGESLQQKSARFAYSALGSVMEGMMPAKVPNDVKQECGNILGEAYALHLAGDEQPSEDFKSRLKTAAKHLGHYSWKWAFILKKVGKYLSTDTGVSDNELQINYKK